MSMPSYPLRAQILAHDAENDGMWVMLPSAVIPFLVRRLYPVADGMRISKSPMPVRGSWGYVQFPGGDVRNGMWMGAYHPNLVDSLPDDASDPFSSYDSNYDGSWSYSHGVCGFSAQQWADNSSFVMGSGNLNVPTLHRHTVTSGQVRQRVPYQQSERNPKPQPPFGWSFNQSVSGQVGGLSITQTPSGSFSMASTVSGQTMAISFNGCTVTIDASGNAHIDLPSSKNLFITQGGGSPTDFLGLVSKLVTAFNSHSHGGIQRGAGSTDPPDQQWTAATIKSTIIDISN